MGPTKHNLRLCVVEQRPPRIAVEPALPHLGARVVQVDQLLRRDRIRVHATLDCLVIYPPFDLPALLAQKQVIVQDIEWLVPLLEGRFVGGDPEQACIGGIVQRGP